MSEKRFVLLIDAENIAAKHLETILKKVINYGEVIYRRVYGDFSDTQMKTWKEKILEHALTFVQQFPYTTGKNATDIALVIDALDILYNKDVDGFCLVSFDSDFTGLAIYLREAGKEVIGIGKSDASKIFKKACCSGFVALPESSKKKKVNNNNREMKEETSKLIINLIKKRGYGDFPWKAWQRNKKD